MTDECQCSFCQPKSKRPMWEEIEQLKSGYIRLSEKYSDACAQLAIRDNRDRDMQEIMRINNQLQRDLEEANACIQRLHHSVSTYRAERKHLG